MEGYQLIKCIGEGGYGSVYQCSDKNGKSYAIKAVTSTSNGITSLVEATIMSSYKHPNIISAIEIIAGEHYFYIVMELAMMDLMSYIKGGYVNTPNIIKNIAQQCLQGIDVLHKHGIIHCDVKPHNILVYPNGNVKIADFSLSMIKLSEHEQFSDKVCTLNYRPPEVLKHSKWNSSIDIWALGCTFYEMIAKRILVPDQSRTQYMNDGDKIFWTNMILSTIRNWRASLGDVDAINDPMTIQPVYAITTNIYWEQCDTGFKSIILKMLSYNHIYRPSCQELLTNNYFNDLPTKHCIINASKVPVINPKISRQIDQYFKHINNISVYVIAMTKELCFRASEIPHNFLKIDTCAWIAQKLINNSVSVDKHQIFNRLVDVVKMEKVICKSLGYRLHVIIPNQLSFIIKPYKELL